MATLPAFTPSAIDVMARDAMFAALYDADGDGVDAVYRAKNAGDGVLVRIKVSAQEPVGRTFRGGLHTPVITTRGASATGNAEGVFITVPRAFPTDGAEVLGTIENADGHVGVLSVTRGDSFEVSGEVVGRPGLVVRLLVSADARAVGGHANATAMIAEGGA